jgi:hypothetical protein
LDLLDDLAVTLIVSVPVFIITIYALALFAPPMHV